MLAQAADPAPPPDAMSALDVREEKMESDESAMMARLSASTVDPINSEEQERLRQLAAEAGK